MGIIIVLILIGLGACLIGSLASKANAKSKEKFNNKINGWQSDYYDELCTACREQGIAMPSKSILDKDEIWVSYQGMAFILQDICGKMEKILYIAPIC